MEGNEADGTRKHFSLLIACERSTVSVNSANATVSVVRPATNGLRGIENRGLTDYPNVAVVRSRAPIRRPSCYPLTIMDHASRYLLRCRGLPGTFFDGARNVFESLCRECGLPDRLRTDNGAPFASIGVGGLSRMSMW